MTHALIAIMGSHPPGPEMSSGSAAALDFVKLAALVLWYLLIGIVVVAYSCCRFVGLS